MASRAYTPTILPALLVVTLALTVSAEEPKQPAGGTRPPKVSSELEHPSRAREDESNLEALSISDAEVDSLIRVAQEAHEAEAGESTQHPWKLDAGVAGLTYNRVEGLNVSFEASLHAPTARTLMLLGEAGYSWAMGKPTWWAGMIAELWRGASHPTIELSHARRVVPYGSGGIPGNSLSALMFGEDYHDWYSSEQWSASLLLHPGPWTFDLGMRVDQQLSVRNHTDFSFFDDGHFRLNPTIDDGEAHILGLAVHYGKDRLAALAFTLEGTAAGHGLGGDFDYDALRGEMISRSPLWFGDQVVAGLAAGTLRGDAPFQALHHLGGFATLRGYETNEFPARQFAHVRFDYVLGTNLLGIVPGLSRLSSTLVPFFDGAAIFETQSRDGSVRKLEKPEFLSSAGIGFQNRVRGVRGGTGNVRFEIARRLDRADAAVTYRIGVALEL